MVPSVFVRLDSLPLTSSGKLDQRALPVPDAMEGSEYRPPVTPEEQAICGLASELLGIERVGTDDDFFLLGGHSLLAARLAAGVRARLGRELPLRIVFDRPRLGALAAALRTLPRTTGPALGPRERPALVPSSFAQRRLWFLQRLEGTAADTYNMPLALRLRGPLDAAALRLAFLDLLARHESLRTLLIEKSGEPWQRILPVEGLGARFDLAVGRSTEAELARRLSATASCGFDLTTDLPLRATLFELGPCDQTLLIVLHHAAGDGWSWSPFLRDLSRAYEARIGARVPDYQPLPVQYADYTLWQREMLGVPADPTSRLAGQLDWWRKHLAGLPDELALPTARARQQTTTRRNGTLARRLDAALHRRLAALARARGVTLFMVLQAAVAALMHRLGAGDDIPIGTAHAGRGEAALDGLVGSLVGTLVLRCDLSGRPSFAQLLERVRERDVEAFAHAETPFELVVDALAPTRALARNPLFQVMVVLQNAPSAELSFSGLTAEPLPVPLETAKFDLAFDFSERLDTAGVPAGLDFDARVQRRPVRARDGRSAVRSATAADGGRARRCRPAAGAPEAALASRAVVAGRGAERDRGTGARRHRCRTPGAAGGGDSCRRRPGRCRSSADLRRAARPGQPLGAPADRSRRRSGSRGRSLPGAVVPAGRGGAGSAQGRRRLPAARPGSCPAEDGHGDIRGGAGARHHCSELGQRAACGHGEFGARRPGAGR